MPVDFTASVLAICAGLGTIPLAGRAGIETPNEEPEDGDAPTAEVLLAEEETNESSTEVD